MNHDDLQAIHDPKLRAYAAEMVAATNEAEVRAVWDKIRKRQDELVEEIVKLGTECYVKFGKVPDIGRK